MIRVFLEDKKGTYKIIAVADHQRDLNNLRLMSYRYRGADKVQLNKDKYGGQYLVLDCDDYITESGPNIAAMQARVDELQKMFD